MILLMLFIVCASANKDVEVFVDGIWVVQAAPRAVARGADKPFFLSLVNVPASHCPQGVKYSQKCEKCAECPECKSFNHFTCKCHSIRRCMINSNNPNSETKIPSDALSNDSTTRVPTTLIPTTAVTIQEIHTTGTTTLTKDATTIAVTTMVINPEIPITTAIIKTKAPIISTTEVATSELPTTSATTTTMVPIILTTEVATSELPTTSTTTTTMVPIILTTEVAISELPTTSTTTTTKAPIISTIEVASSELPTTSTTTTVKAPITLVPTTIVNTSEFVTTKTTQIPNTKSSTKLFPTTEVNISEISTRTTISEDTITQAVTPKALLTNSSKTSDAEPWLHSGQCGPRHPLPDGSSSQCNPQGEHPCCNPNSGWCGSTSKHCVCKGCIDYRGFSDSWLHGGRCGPQHRLPSGRPGQCNPQGETTCCNPISGWCGNTKAHCACRECIDYRETLTPLDLPSEELSTSSSKAFDTDPWLYGGRCGPQHLLPDGRHGQCNPQGKHPCCNSISGWCGKTKGHCACKDCIDYRNLN